MRKPTFTARHYPEMWTTFIAIGEPKDVVGKLEGYEVLMKSGGLVSVHPWGSVANLSILDWHYRISGIEPLSTYTVTVRGRFTSNEYSAMADPVEFMGVNEARSAPQNLRLVALDSHRVRMTWDPPLQSYDFVTAYSVGLIIDGYLMTPFTVAKNRSFTYTRMEPGQKLSAFVRATSLSTTLTQLELAGRKSRLVSIRTPPSSGGELHPYLS
ncbi:unnamed protein product [Hydatigera taeniaeformis]|uniref:Fibronectin type-III domain-containing protein n=1 Tax=Hydatigena taeniaeformis TaxID=6205 RepID=A0A0R3WYY1_HYDTA|nr:unnamed protein product [Hydatigera taeniaeformis]